MRIKVIAGRSYIIDSVFAGFFGARRSTRVGWCYRASCGVHQLRLDSFVLLSDALTSFNLGLFFRMFANLLGAESRTFLFALDSQPHLLELVGGSSVGGWRELRG